MLELLEILSFKNRGSKGNSELGHLLDVWNTGFKSQDSKTSPKLIRNLTDNPSSPAVFKKW